MSNKLKCSECGCLEDYDNPLHTDRDDIIICDECGLKSRCFCDECGEYVPTSECIVEDLSDYKLTKCCDSYSTYHDETLCCKSCWNEVEVGEGDGTEFSGIEITNVLCGQCQSLHNKIMLHK